MLDKEQLINEIFAENNRLPQNLDALETTVSTIPNINLYLFELMQNAIDVKSTKIYLTYSEDCIIFEHNGETFGHTATHVRGISNVFQSSKKIDSIGFMGFGFKTIYKRFKECHISDQDGWKFKFLVDEVSVPLFESYSVFARKWLGAFLPRWDPEIAGPSHGQTRFMLKGVTSETASTHLLSDLSDLFDNHFIVLAILSIMDLKEFGYYDETTKTEMKWNLTRRDDRIVVNVSKNGEHVRTVEWLLLAHSFVPSDSAVASFCQARLKNILEFANSAKMVSSVWESIKRSHTLYGLVLLSDSDKFIRRSNGGTVFSTFPLSASMPFHIHIQAPWLLDLSRKGLREIKTNEWQKCLFAETAQVLVLYLKHIATLKTRKEVREAYQGLSFRLDAGSDFDLYSDVWVETLKRELKNCKFVPIASIEQTDSDPVEFKTLDEVFLAKSFEVDIIPREVEKIFGRFFLDTKLMCPVLMRYLTTLKLVEEIQFANFANEMRSNGLANWWNSRKNYSKSVEDDKSALFSLWCFLSTLFSPKQASTLPCVLCGDGTWVPPTAISVLAHNDTIYDYPTDATANGATALRLLSSTLPKSNTQFPPSWVTSIVKGSSQWGSLNRKAFEWISKYWNKLVFRDLIFKAIEARRSEITPTDMLSLSAWLVERDSPLLITHLVVANSNDSSRSLELPAKSLLRSPYLPLPLSLLLGQIYPNAPTIVDDYLNFPLSSSLENLKRTQYWTEAFTSLSVLWKLVFEVKVVGTVSALPDYHQSKRTVAQWLCVPYEDLLEFQSTNAYGWKYYDIDFAVNVNDNEVLTNLAPWLCENVETIANAKSQRYAEGYNRRFFYEYAVNGSAKWVQTLNSLPWLNFKGNWTKPDALTRDEALAILTVECFEVLKEKGVTFIV